MMKKQKKERKTNGKLLNGYGRVVGFALRHKFLVLLAAVAALGVSAYFSVAKGFIFMPDMDMPSLNLTIGHGRRTAPWKKR